MQDGVPLLDQWSLATLWVVFGTGVMGGFSHCIGMCGPVLSAVSLAEGVTGEGAGRLGRAAGFQAGYHAGRILTYALIGAALGLLGSSGALSALGGPAWMNGAQRYISLVAGVITALIGLALLGIPYLGGVGRALESGLSVGTSNAFQSLVGRILGWGPWAAFPLGLLMGFLPCGFLLSIEAQALASGSVLAGGATMLAFGLGTLPALAGFGLAAGYMGERLRGFAARVGALCVVALGVMTVVRALQMLTLAGGMR